MMECDDGTHAPVGFLFSALDLTSVSVLFPVDYQTNPDTKNYSTPAKGKKKLRRAEFSHLLRPVPYLAASFVNKDIQFFWNQLA